MLRDSHNAKSSENIIVPLTNFEGGGLWLEKDSPTDDDNPRELRNGQTIYGRMVGAQKGKAIRFHPKGWHQVQPWEGDRIIFLMYTPRGTKLTEDNMKELEGAGFPIDRKIFQNQEDEEECDARQEIEDEKRSR